MDADDVSLPHRLDRQVAWLDEHPEVVLLGTTAFRINSEGRFLERMVSISKAPTDVSWHLTHDVPLLIHSSILARTDIFRALGGYRAEFVHAEDYDLWLRTLERGRVMVLPEPLLLYRSNPDGIRLNRVVEATHSRAYALDCYRRRSQGKAERSREEFLQSTDLRLAEAEMFWSSACEMAMLGNVQSAAQLTQEALYRRPDHLELRLASRLLAGPFAGLAAGGYRRYRRFRGWISTLPIGPLLSRLKHAQRMNRQT